MRLADTDWREPWQWQVVASNFASTSSVTRTNAARSSEVAIPAGIEDISRRLSASDTAGKIANKSVVDPGRIAQNGELCCVGDAATQVRHRLGSKSPRTRICLRFRGSRPTVADLQAGQWHAEIAREISGRSIAPPGRPFAALARTCLPWARQRCRSPARACPSAESGHHRA